MYRTCLSSRMDTKEDIATRVNDKLGTRIEWDRMTKDDLQHFEELIDEGLLVKPMVEEIAKEEGKKKLENVVDDWQPGAVIEKLL